MIRSAALFPIALALGAIILAPRGDGAQAQDAREEGPREIEKCQTISNPGSYKLVNDLAFSAPTGTCLDITASSVTIDLAGFTISGPGQVLGITATAIAAGGETRGITVRNGSISRFDIGVGLGGDGSIVEGLRVFDGISAGIIATGIVKGNSAVGMNGGPGAGSGISAAGIVTGNYASHNRFAGIEIGQGSTVIGNTSTQNGPTIPGFGIVVSCPSNVTDNTAVNNAIANLVLNGEGCHNEDNVAP
jgi:hypothetical protein